MGLKCISFGYIELYNALWKSAKYLKVLLYFKRKFVARKKN